MELTTTADTIITASVLLATLVSFFSAAVWWVKLIEWDKHQSREINGIRREQTLICYGIMACLKGLESRAVMIPLPRCRTSSTSI